MRERATTLQKIKAEHAKMTSIHGTFAAEISRLDRAGGAADEDMRTRLAARHEEMRTHLRTILASSSSAPAPSELRGGGDVVATPGRRRRRRLAQEESEDDVAYGGGGTGALRDRRSGGCGFGGEERSEGEREVPHAKAVAPVSEGRRTDKRRKTDAVKSLEV
ncbi:hypothetical protein HK405_008143 [Cladochytrium tenue]|nr:hypothetical protein HK405_008143 [Cladochytrium tenue]